MNLLAILRDYRRQRQAHRREQAVKERLIIGAYDSGKNLAHVMAGLAFIGLTDEDKQKLEGTELKCVFCGKTFRHTSKCTLGFCPRCSK